MQACMNPSTVGRRLELQEYLAVASGAGFPMADIDAASVIREGAGQVREWLDTYGVKWASFGLPLGLDASDAEFSHGLEQLVEAAAVAAQFGVTRCVTWLWPSIDAEPARYALQLAIRARACADVLARHEIRLGLEFVGPHHLRRKKYPFIHNIPDLLVLLDAVERDNVGVLLDSYHWYTSGQSMADLKQLPLSRVVHVHVNDTSAPPEEAHDQERLLPGEGRIDLRAFVGYLSDVGYDGPLSVEVLRRTEPDQSPEAVANKAYKATMRLIGA